MIVQDGGTLPPREFGPISRTDIVRYQGASGDFNPIHHDDDFAIAAGFPGVFVVGMLSAGYLASYCSDLVGAECIRNFRVRFHEQVWPGDMLKCTATVVSTATQLTSHNILVTLELTATRQTGTVAASAEAKALIPAETNLLQD